mgnify:CR=1 FL=1
MGLTLLCGGLSAQHKYATYLPHTAGRYQTRRFRKADAVASLFRFCLDRLDADAEATQDASRCAEQAKDEARGVAVDGSGGAREGPGRTPATQDAASGRTRNELGWGNWSLKRWLSTIRVVPGAPQPALATAASSAR